MAKEEGKGSPAVDRAAEAVGHALGSGELEEFLIQPIYRHGHLA